MPEIQTLDARYITSADLLALLRGLFGNGNFKIDVSHLRPSSFSIFPYNR